MAPDRMLVETQRYGVMVSQSLYRWLMFEVLRAIVDAGPGAWNQSGRVSYERVETLYARGRQVELAGQGRLMRLAQRDARTLMGILDLARTGRLPVPPASSQSLSTRLAWQVGDLDRMPGQISERASRIGGCIQLGDGRYVVIERLPAGER